MKQIRSMKRLLAVTKSATSRCWNDAVDHLQKQNPNLTIDDIKMLEGEEYDKLSEDYRRRVCALPTNILEGILTCHDSGRQQRAKITLASIRDELARRTLLGDSSYKGKTDTENNQ